MKQVTKFKENFIAEEEESIISHLNEVLPNDAPILKTLLQQKFYLYDSITP
jgi:hypothetical protein